MRCTGGVKSQWIVGGDWDVNVREGPSVQARVITSLGPGSVVSSEGSDAVDPSGNVWIKLEGGQHQYVMRCDAGRRLSIMLPHKAQGRDASQTLQNPSEAARKAEEERIAAEKKRAEEDARFSESLYHATNLTAALKIQEGGFRVPKGTSEQKAGALLGPGVYCTATLQKAIHYCHGKAGGIIFQLAVDLGNCKKLEENDPLMKTWQDHGYDSAWAPEGAGGRGGKGLEENCVKDPAQIKIKQAIAGDTHKLQDAGYLISAQGRIEKVGSKMRSLDDEIAAVSGMNAADIKQELVQRGLSIKDMFEKHEFVKRLAEARVSGRQGVIK
jgi:hypothetical protein